MLNRSFFVKMISLLLAVVMVAGILPISAFAEGSVTNYADFLANLKVLEGYASTYGSQVGRDKGELVLNFIRTGVDRYNDDNWTTLAGPEIVGFTSYVQTQDEQNGTTAMNLKDIVTDEFVLPNGDKVDFGHMFGCMNISYLSSGSADLSGWAGDLCDLLDYSVREIATINANTDGTVEGMTAYISENCFGVDASDAFGWDDFYGDMDAYYLITEYKKGNGSFSALMESYFDSDLSDVERSVYFVNSRFGVEDSNEAVRKAVFEAYSSDVGIKILESKRGLTSYNALREACCNALADYLYSQAKGQIVPGAPDESGPANGYYSVFSNEHSILAPGIEQDINYAQTADGKQIVYYVATVDVTRDDVTIMANYKDNDPSKGWGLQKVADQVAALVNNYKNKTDANGNKVYENFNAIVATNGDGYNITNGTPGGLLVMDGVEYYPVDKDGFFAILKDGSAVIGTKAEYEQYKDEIKEAIGGFGAVLVKDGKINVTKNANYTSSRASRTAIGITAEGKVVMMVLDGRQLPRSAGGAMEEIAQIMLEAGCVHAINLDGGGSTTYLSKPAGSDDIQLVNTPSDGYERSVAVSLVAISTAKSSNEFDHAVISSGYDYITAGTSMKFDVIGVSNTGNSAQIPAGSYWRVSDETLGHIAEDGTFTAAWSEEGPVVGDVIVEYVVNGQVAGSKVVHIVVPDDIKFAEDRITAIYGVPKEIQVTVWYQGSPVAFTPLMDVGIFFPGPVDDEGNMELLFESDAGVIDGITLTGSDAKKVRSAKIIAALQAGEDIVVRYATVNLYYKDEATFDFENATQGNRKLAWNREIENAKSTDNQLYRISDPDSPVEIEYTFALDMTAIDFPAQLEPIKSMLPTYQENATAWTYMLQLAERVCTQTNVTIRAEFSQDLEVDISELKVINDYFTMTSVSLDENNVLTLVCNWVNQSEPIDAATANPLCILSGLKATVKDTAAYYNNEILIANNGYVSYDVYLAASSLYNFAENPDNQAKYGLYPYIHEDDCRGDFSSDFGDDETLVNNDRGARFSSQYIDFADIYVLNNEIRQGWHEEGSDYYYYVDNVALTGTQLVPDRHDSTKKRFYEFDEEGKLVSEQGTTGLIHFEDNLYYAVQGVAQTGWQQIDGNNYYFHPDTGRAVNGVYQIKEKMNPAVAEGKYTPMVWYTYTFTDYVLTRGDMVYDENVNGNDGNKHTGYHYRWAGNWMNGWFEVGEDTYFANKNYPCMVSTGYQRVLRQDATDSTQTQYHLFDENGVFQKNYTGAYFDGTNYAYLKNGVRQIIEGVYEADGYYYYVEGSGLLFVNGLKYIQDSRANGYVTPNKSYNFDEQGRLCDTLVTVDVKTAALENAYTVFGSTVTVNSKQVCGVVYLSAGKYVEIEGVKRSDGSTYFTAPAGVSQVLLLVKGDFDGSGTVSIGDVTILLNAIAGKNGLDAWMNGDFDESGIVSIGDVTILLNVIAGKDVL